MGESESKPKSNLDEQSNQAPTAPTITCAPCLSNYPNQVLHLVLAFFAGILLTLLLMAIVIIIIKNYRKCHSSPQALDLHSDPLAKFPSIPEEALTSPSMTYKISEEKSDHLTANHSADSNAIVYAQIKVTNSPCVSDKA